MSIYDSPYSQPQIVGYDPLGRPVYNRNARQKTLGMDPSLGGLDGFGFGGPTTSTTQTGGGANPLGMARQAIDAVKTGKDIYNYGSELFGGSSAAPATPTYGGGVPLDFEGNVAFADNLAPMGFEENIGLGGADLFSGGAYGAPGGGFGGGLGAVGEGGGGAAAFGLGGATGSYGALGGGFGGGLGGAGMGGGGAAAFGVGGGAGAGAGAGAAGAGAGSLAATLGPAVPPLLAMYAIMQLGGAFDPTTPIKAAGGYGTIGPDGFNVNLGDMSKGGAMASPEHMAQAQQALSFLNGLDLSKWNGGGGYVGYGSDKDRGFDNPAYDVQFYEPGDNGRMFAINANDLSGLQSTAKRFAELGPSGLAALSPLDYMMLATPGLSLDRAQYELSLLGQQDSA